MVRLMAEDAGDAKATLKYFIPSSIFSRACSPITRFRRAFAATDFGGISCSSLDFIFILTNLCVESLK